MTFITPRERFRGALLGSLLGPLYCFQLGLFHGEPQERPGDRSNTSVSHPLTFRQLSPAAKDWLCFARRTLELSSEAMWEAPSLEQKRTAPSETEALAGDSSRKEASELQLLRLLPQILVRSAWLSSQASLAQHLWAAHRTALEALRSSSTDQPFSTTRQADLEAAWAMIESSLQRCSQSGELALLEWLNSPQSALSDGRGQAELTPVQRCLGSQLIALSWGATQGARGLPWAAKAWLGSHHAGVVRLGDRLYSAWAGQADFEKLGVSCEGSLTLITPTV